MAVRAAATATLRGMLEQAPRIERLLQGPDVIYLGPCVVQAPGAWTRIGPTWLVPGVGTLVIGPGLARWGTSQGLAQLAVDAAACKPEWHAVAIAVTATPNIIFALTSASITAPCLASVAALAAEVEVKGG